MRVNLMGELETQPDPMEVPVYFNNDEMVVLTQLLDMVVKAYGLQVAGHAVYFQNKLRGAIVKD